MSTIAVNAITDASGGNTASINGATPTTDNTMGRNRIINGAMEIDARNAGAAVTTSASYVVDRFQYQNDSDATLSLQQSSTAPAGFSKSIAVTVTTADASVGATQYSMITQRIEGFNMADFGWGTANAKTVTLSFWVRSSVTGTFGGVFNNDGSARSYPYTYSINSADTWEYKTVTIVGDTSGTWLSTNGTGIQLRWAFGMGSTYAGTAGSWSANTYFGASGCVNLISTLNATFYITGVQLEAGSVATSFERVDYSEMLRRCQRYYQVLGDGTDAGVGSVGARWVTRDYFAQIFYLTKRATPTVSVKSGTAQLMNNGSAQGGLTPTFQYIGRDCCCMRVIGTTVTDGAASYIQGESLKVAITAEL